MLPDSPHPIAVRLVSRHSSELALSAMAAVERFLPGMGDGAIVALTILRTCLPDWIDDDRIRCPAVLTRHASIHSVAMSLGHPYATVHRLVGKLRRHGVVVSVDGGIAISHDGAWSAAVLCFLDDAHDILLRFVGELVDAGQLDLSLRIAARQPPIRSIVATALDMFLMPFEMFRERIGDWTSKKLWLAISTLTVRHVTTDPALNARYAYASTPNAQRRPVPSAVLCRVTATSTATAWRHCTAMTAVGTVTRDERGWMLCTHELLEARMEAAVQGAVAFYIRRIEELMALGLDPGDLAYRHARPPLVAYDPLPA